MAAPGARAQRKVRPAADFPDRLQPQLATLVAQPPEGSDWLHEIKYDGYRLLGRVQAGRVRLLTRNGKDWTDRFPAIVSALAALDVDRAWIDGEVVALQDDGRSSFAALQQELSSADDSNLSYMVFDLLYLNGVPLLQRPLTERKQALRALFERATDTDPVRYSDHVSGSGAKFLRQACAHGLEGVISKRADVPYVPGRGKGWLKTKCEQRQEFVIGGYTESDAAGRPFGALLLGFYDRGRFEYAGRVGTGFNARNGAELFARLQPLEIASSPFASRPPQAGRDTVHWLRPQLVAEVRFSNWTTEGRLRHPSFEGLREDKLARDVGRELPAAAEREHSSPSAAAASKLSNAEKILYPERGLSKRDLAHYYEAVAAHMLPHVANRPLTLLRCPDGHHGQCFFQKHITGELPPGLAAVAVESEGEQARYPVLTSAQGLIGLVQLGTLELHAWGARSDRLDRPDQLVFDLDPGPQVGWPRTVEAAMLLRTLLQALGLSAFLKTTGGKGLHVVVPITRRHDWVEVKAFSKAVAQQLVRFDPAGFTTRLAKTGRDDKIFVDYLRNGRGATAVACYSTRARAGAPVAVPLHWEALEDDVRSDQFTVADVDSWLDRDRTDPWQGFQDASVNLTAAMWRTVQTS